MKILKALIVGLMIISLLSNTNTKKLKTKATPLHQGILMIFDVWVEIKISFIGDGESGFYLEMNKDSYSKLVERVKEKIDITQFITDKHQGVFAWNEYKIPYCKIDSVKLVDNKRFNINLVQNFQLEILLDNLLDDLEVRLEHLIFVRHSTLTVNFGNDQTKNIQKTQIHTRYIFNMNDKRFHFSFNWYQRKYLESFKQYVDKFNGIQQYANYYYENEERDIDKDNFGIKLNTIKSIEDDPKDPQKSILIFKNENGLVLEFNVLKSTTINLRKVAGVYLDAEPEFSSTYIQVNKLINGKTKTSWGFAGQYRSENLSNNLFGFDLIVYKQDFNDRQELIHDLNNQYLDDNKAMVRLCNVFKNFNSIIERPANYYIPLTQVEGEVTKEEVNINFSKLKFVLPYPFDVDTKYEAYIIVNNDHLGKIMDLLTAHYSFLNSISKNLENRQLFCLGGSQISCQNFEGTEATSCLNGNLGFGISMSIKTLLNNPYEYDPNDNTVKFSRYLCSKYSSNLNNISREYEKSYKAFGQDILEFGDYSENKISVLDAFVDGY